MALSSGEVPNEPGFNRTEKELSLVRKLSCTLYIVENPFDFGGGEISIDEKTCVFLDVFLKSGLFL